MHSVLEDLLPIACKALRDHPELACVSRFLSTEHVPLVPGACTDLALVTQLHALPARQAFTLPAVPKGTMDMLTNSLQQHLSASEVTAVFADLSQLSADLRGTKAAAAAALSAALLQENCSEK